MMGKVTDSSVRKAYGGVILFLIFILAGIVVPSGSQAVKIEDIKPLVFSAEDKGKVKIVIFSAFDKKSVTGLMRASPGVHIKYEAILEALLSIDPQKYKIAINPFTIDTFSKNELFAIKAGQKLNVDFVILIEMNNFVTFEDIDRINYTAINIHNQKAFNASLDTSYSGLAPTQIANQLFDRWKAFLSAGTPPPREGLQGAMLEVKANVEGAVVAINGEERGITPLTLDGIKPGNYAVKVSKEGYRPYEERVRVAGGETFKLEVALEPATAAGTIRVAGSPEGAKVYLDGYFCCTLPCTIGQVATGKHTVMVKKPDYRDWEVKMNVVAGQQLQLEVELERVSTQKVSTQKGLLVGKVTSIEGDSIELDVGAQSGVRVGDTGRVFYKVSIEGKEKPIYVAMFKIAHVLQNSSVAQIEDKTGEVQVGYQAEIKR